jgi:Ca-activated chloride channel family protein
LDTGRGDRVGLVVFAGSAHLQFPLTTDPAAASLIVDRLQSGSGFVSGGSALGQALDLAGGAFDDSSSAGRLVVLVTDGDDLGDDPATPASRLHFSGVSLLVAGVGTTEGAPIPVVDTEGGVQFLRDDSGVLISRLNDELLVRVADAGEGRYLGNDIAGLPGAVRSRVDALQTAQIATSPAVVPIERFGRFSLAAALLVVAALVGSALPANRWRRRPAVATVGILAIGLLVGACAQRSYELNQDGLDAFTAGDYAGAIDAFHAASLESPADARLSLNLALAYDAAGQYVDAARVAERATASPDREVSAAAFKLLGHERFEQQDYEGALAAFHDALVLAPDDAAARHDYEVVYAILNPPGRSEDDNSEPGQPGASTPTPSSGPEGTPGPGTPGANPSSTPGPGQTAEPSGSPTPGPGLSDAEIESQIARIDSEARSIADEAGDTLTQEQALRLLELNELRNRLSSLLQSEQDSTNPADR